MNIKFIAMGLLTATVISTAAFADDMQQNMQQGAQGTPSTAMTNDQSKNMGAMPLPQGTNPTQNPQGTAMPAATSGTTGTTGTPNTTGTTGNTTQTGTY